MCILYIVMLQQVLCPLQAEDRFGCTMWRVEQMIRHWMNALFLAGVCYQPVALTPGTHNSRVKVLLSCYARIKLPFIFCYRNSRKYVKCFICGHDIITPIAVLPNCGPIPVVENSTPIQNNARVLYACLSGFTLFGSPILTCLANETWSPSPPICNGML